LLNAYGHLAPNEGTLTVDHRISDLLTPVRGKTVQHDGARFGLLHKTLVDSKGRKIETTPLGLGLEAIETQASV